MVDVEEVVTVAVTVVLSPLQEVNTKINASRRVSETVKNGLNFFIFSPFYD
ncbi:MAG: hypothetical protein PHG35_00060 [Dehalococcoidales bacterium]|nr:hypothetical protein [Dehalococcoidales bacterium]